MSKNITRPVLALVFVGQITALATVTVVTVAQIVQTGTVCTAVLFWMTLIAVATFKFGR